MAKLDFLGKGDVAGHHLSVPFHTLTPDVKKSVGKGSLEDNLIIQGDNLLALKALLPRYAGKIKCIYIDPPYNTGNEDWAYNDKVNSPLIKNWLEKAVNSEDQTRHDKWLCMMYPRLKLLRKLLCEDGVIFVSIDDNEQHFLRTIMDEIFGEDNFISIFTWVRKKKGSFLSPEIRKMTEFVLAYKNTTRKVSLHGEKAYSDKYRPIVKRENKIKELSIGKNIVSTTLADGEYKAINKLSKSETGVDFKNGFSVKDGMVITVLKLRGRFTWGQEFLDDQISKGTKIALSKEYGFNALKHDQEDKVKAPSTLLNKECEIGTNEDATNELQEIFGNIHEFKYAKPTSLIKFLIKSVVNGDKNSIVLDSFAGSGTTAQAVLDLNKEGENYKFILVECENYADKITAERVRRVIKGVPNAKNESIKKGLGGSFTYATLGDEIDHEKLLTGESMPSWSALARHVFWLATGETLEKEPKERKDYFVGKHKNDSVYLLYKPDINFLQSNKAVLTGDVADELGKNTKQGDRILYYAAAAYVSTKDMEKSRITFCQLPWAISKKAWER